MSDEESVGTEESIELKEVQPLVKNEAAEVPPAPRSVNVAICVSHALSTWSERTWTFAVGLIFLEIYHDSLFFVSLFGLVQALASVVFSPSIGVYIDRTPRLKAVTIFYFIQNLGLVLAAISSLILLANKADPSGPTGTAAALAVVIFGILSRVGTMGGTIAVEKEWTKALTAGRSQDLAKINSTLKTIDLVCLIVGPIVSGFLMNYCSMVVATTQILVYNLVAWFPEVALLRFAVARAPQLQIKATKEEEKSEKNGIVHRVTDYCKSIADGVQLYFKQSCVLASLSLAMLHLTVLSFGILMTAYLKWLGYSEAVLSLYRGFAALTGVLGAKAFPRFHSRMSLRTSGFFSLFWFLTFVAIGAAPDILNLGWPISPDIRFNFLVWSISVSRFFLWLFDLSVSQIIQEWVSEGELGRVSATQKLLENAFTVFIFVAGLIAPRPQDFVWLMCVSVVAVTSSFIFFIFFLMKSRNAPQNIGYEIEMNQSDV